jgi:hypothetical protein
MCGEMWIQEAAELKLYILWHVDPLIGGNCEINNSTSADAR